MIAEIIVDVQNKQVNRTFDYLIPAHLENIIKVGYRVKVPFGNITRVGFVLEIKNSTEYKNNLKEIIDTVDVTRVLNEEFISLAKYIAENNFSFYATALETMIPTALKIKYQKIATIINKEKLSKEALDLFKRKEIILDNLPSDKQKIIYQEVNNGNVSLDTRFKRNRNEKLLTYVKLNDTLLEPKSRQGKALIEFLQEINEDVEMSLLLNDSGYSKAVIDTLIKQGIVSIYTKEYVEEKSEKLLDKPKIINLNQQQQRVYEALDYSKSKTYLLHGVTGSGKTEVYMRWIEDVIASGKSAIMLVPEISLTPQITSIFLARFKESIAILHSRLSIADKYDAWKRIINGEVKIVVGARSAIFAPLNNLGIIIIDECHESTYIQQNNPKYNAIEIAKLRGEHFNCPLVLGSATPNVIDYFYATNGEYELLKLPTRANGRRLKNAEVVDLRKELEEGNKSVLSRRLSEALVECYKNKEQSILFLNRRGFSSFVMCRSCGNVVKCPHCDVSLTYHQYSNSLKCHYCGYQMPNVSKCSNCGSDKIRFVGSGTEKIMDAVTKLIPEAKVIRVDMDTTTKIEDYEYAYNAFKNQEADILVGTQMITKGLDFDNVTLVGVVNADLALQYPIYDASMVAFNLIEQVSGRAGRATKEGNIIIQTYNPNHYVIDAAASHDYEGFYNKEIQNRMITMMPPYSEVVEIMIESKDANKAHIEAKHIAATLRGCAKESIILGPVEAPIFKKKDIFRFTIQVQAIEDKVLDKIKYIYPLYQNNKDITLSITRM